MVRGAEERSDEAGMPAYACRTIRVGVAGHRWNRIDRMHLTWLRTALAEKMALIAKAAALPIAAGQDVGAEAGACDEADTQFTLVSGMAEGADLVAATMRPAGWALEAVLPLARDLWRTHLAEIGDTADVAMFDRVMERADVLVLPHADGPAYEALADHIARSCDCLIAVWNGQTGNPGGTGDVVAKSRARGIDLHILTPPSGKV